MVCKLIFVNATMLHHLKKIFISLFSRFKYYSIFNNQTTMNNAHSTSKVKELFFCWLLINF